MNKPVRGKTTYFASGVLWQRAPRISTVTERCACDSAQREVRSTTWIEEPDVPHARVRQRADFGRFAHVSSTAPMLLAARAG
jgi:hypothetical protein